MLAVFPQAPCSLSRTVIRQLWQLATVRLMAVHVSPSALAIPSFRRLRFGLRLVIWRVVACDVVACSYLSYSVRSLSHIA